jgi:hypothetical protein
VTGVQTCALPIFKVRDRVSSYRVHVLIHKIHNEQVADQEFQEPFE